MAKKPSKFRDLAVGQVFHFASLHDGFATMAGPWRKVSARLYDYADGRGVRHEVGTIHVDVCLCKTPFARRTRQEASK
jgi:hypothetical protein